MNKVGILAYGSLVSDPGIEIEPLIIARIKTKTPFPVEYLRLSHGRAGAPTLAPSKSGIPVSAEVLVLADNISLDLANDLLWRRETRNEGTNLKYRTKASPNAVIIQVLRTFAGINQVLYTDFHSIGKLDHPTPSELAKAAIASVQNAPVGKDGITYLMNRISDDVKTELSDSYIRDILLMTNSKSLTEAYEVASRRFI
ncbi:MAG: hypothetical protein P1P76_10290 [Anaerolineales bacterium]|nr:hypothetical protein [Anaerolineales bacterium]